MSKNRQFSRRDFLKYGTALALSLGGISACTPSATPATKAPEPGTTSAPATNAPAAGPVKLTFVCDTVNVGHVKVRDEWAKKFNEKYANITVDHQPVPTQDYNTKIQTLYAAGTAPDIYRYLQEVAPIATVVAKKMHLPLDSVCHGPEL